MKNRKPYTPDELQYIKDNWQKMTDAEIAEALNRQVKGIKMKRQTLKLNRRKGRPQQEKPTQATFDKLAFYQQNTPAFYGPQKVSKPNNTGLSPYDLRRKDGRVSYRK